MDMTLLVFFSGMLTGCALGFAIVGVLSPNSECERLAKAYQDGFEEGYKKGKAVKEDI